jgi:cell division protein FtsX
VMDALYMILAAIVIGGASGSLAAYLVLRR